MYSIYIYTYILVIPTVTHSLRGSPFFGGFLNTATPKSMIWTGKLNQNDVWR